MGHRQPVVGDGNVADFPLLFGLQGGVVQAVLPAGLGTEGGIVELIDVDIVGVQKTQAGLQMLPHSLGGLRAGLGGDDHLVPHTGEGIAHLLLTVGVGPCGVKVVHPSVHRLLEQIGGLLLRHPLNGQTAEAVFLNLDTGGA